ncbi:ADAMTS-like protein 2 isoform X1 [Synchiropus splendidus]|uniref:ADAMTS-like protein 2 isoform X1 n=1 Tax=Synchiropus splendidus TaxID=270530 RepID=UPI00237E20F9|nr:ADAMTS-like protein 2 isoform X1 [Synchiropus splendidus]
MLGIGGFTLPVCSFLVLHIPVLTQSIRWPPKDRSELRVERRNIHLQLQNYEGPVVKKSPAKEEVFHWWGEWSSWSSCSRSCGGGVRSKERHCLIQRFSTTESINNSYCIGSPKQYQLCPNQPCPSSSLSFKQHQCSQFNSKAFGRNYYEWIPLYPADYISISNKPCDLQCTTVSGERQLLVPAHDGTFCRDTKYHGICIEGTCQPVGCDGQLYSTKSVDRCGVCGGNGTSCQRISGSYRKALTQLGYLFIINIPAGATDIQVIERHKTENILGENLHLFSALSDEEGNFIFNGNTVFDHPQNFKVAGTIIKYRRPGNVFADGLEYIIAPGPTLQGLNVMYYNINGKLPHITYEYTIPLQPHPATAVEDITLGPLLTLLNYTYENVNNSRGMANAHPYETDPQQKKDEQVVWDGLTPSPHPPAAMVMYRPVDTTRQVLNNNVEGGAPGPPSYFPKEASSNLIDDPSATGDNTLVPSFPGSQSVHSVVLPEATPFLLLEKHHFNKTHSHTKPNVQSVQRTVIEPSALSHAPNTDSELEPPTKILSLTETRDNSSDSQTPKLVHMQQAVAVLAASTESNDFDVGLVADISLADMYRWKVSAYAPCSSTCTTGISTSYALCIRYDGSEVDDSYCDSLTRPEPTHEFCTGKECPPRWETSGWSECSRTCGEGFQYRTVRCWKMLSPGLDSSVYDSLCLSHDLHKPANRKVCFGQSCGPQWEVSEWSECSAPCGSRGLRSREVRCSMEMKLCNDSSQPMKSQECEGPPCDRRWTVADWGPCSGVCGEGRMVRGVTCRSSTGVVMSEEQCPPFLRPLAIYPCGDRDCAPHWVEQEWQQCNATCGRGVKNRQVVCAGLEGGVFKEFPESSCGHRSKPETSSSCFQRPCSKWFTTSWSQCSKTCGSGVQVREVKCYQGEEIVTRGHSCDSSLKPDAKQKCDIQSCPTDSTVNSEPEPARAPSPSGDSSCNDKPTANCALVLKVKLCTHWYYRKACCQSCNAPRP